MYSAIFPGSREPGIVKRHRVYWELPKADPTRSSCCIPDASLATAFRKRHGVCLIEYQNLRRLNFQVWKFKESEPLLTKSGRMERLWNNPSDAFLLDSKASWSVANFHVNFSSFRSAYARKPLHGHVANYIFVDAMDIAPVSAGNDDPVTLNPPLHKGPTPCSATASRPSKPSTPICGT